MLDRLVQPGGASANIINLQTLANIFGLLDEEVGYLEKSTNVTDLIILFDYATSNVFKVEDITGVITEFSYNSDESINLVTSTGSFNVSRFRNRREIDAELDTAASFNKNMITDFFDRYQKEDLKNGKVVNVDSAITAAQEKGIYHLYFPDGHFEIATIIQISDIVLIGSNPSEFSDVVLEDISGASGKLSLDTKGSVLHITGQSAANGITLRPFSSPSSYVGVHGFSIYYPEQDWKNWLSSEVDIDGNTIYSPTIFPATFTVLNPMRVSFTNLFFINAYHWIDISNAQQVAIHDIAGTLINEALTINRMAAGGYCDTLNAYPYWTWACNFAGNSQRVNSYCDYHGKGVQVGSDDGTTRTVEQMHFTRITIIGCADGIIINGKGTSVNYAKIDNCMRGITINSVDNSAYHTLSNIWVSSYYRNNYVPKQRTDGTCYGIKSNTSTPISINSVQIIRADGYGIWLPYASGTVVSNCIVQQCMYTAYVFGSSGRTTDVISVNGCFAGMYAGDTSLTQIAFIIGDFLRCDIKGLQWKGANTVTRYVLNNTTNFYEQGKELDLSTLGGSLEKGTGNSSFSKERGPRGYIVGISSTDVGFTQQFNIRGLNNGATGTNVGIGVRNTVSNGNGHGALGLYASISGVATAIAEVYSDGGTHGLRPTVAGQYFLGDATYPWRSGFFKNAVYIDGNPAISLVAVPATATSTGVVGQVAQDANYFYVCTATNTWKRSPLSTW